MTAALPSIHCSHAPHGPLDRGAFAMAHAALSEGGYGDPTRTVASWNERSDSVSLSFRPTDRAESTSLRVESHRDRVTVILKDDLIGARGPIRISMTRSDRPTPPQDRTTAAGWAVDLAVEAFGTAVAAIDSAASRPSDGPDPESELATELCSALRTLHDSTEPLSMLTMPSPWDAGGFSENPTIPLPTWATAMIRATLPPCVAIRYESERNRTGCVIHPSRYMVGGETDPIQLIRLVSRWSER